MQKALLVIAASILGTNMHGDDSVVSPAARQVVPMRVAVAGLVHGHVDGFFRQELHRTDIQIVGIAEADQALATRYADRLHLDKALLYTSLDELLSRVHPQAVVAYTNTYDHRSVVETCARHGVPVMMEKPLAVSMADAKAIEQAAAKGRIQVLVNYETTWCRSNRAAYDLVHEKSLGDIRKIVAHAGHGGPKEIGCGPDFLAWLTDPKLNGAGAMFDFGCYGADLAAWLLDGQRPTTVTAISQHIKPDVYPKVEDEATIIVTYAKAQLIIQASWNWPFDRKDIEVYGERGSVVTVGRDQVRVRKSRESGEQQLDAPPILAPDDDYLAYLRAVVLEGRKPSGPSSLATNMVVMEILDAARESARTGRTIQLH